MQGGWARRQGRDLCAGGSGVGCRLRGVGRSIGTTNGVVNEHTKNCINASASASTNTVKNASASSTIFEQNDDGIHSARAKAGTATTIAEVRRRSAASRAATAPAPPASPSPQGGRPIRLAVTMGRTARKEMKAGTAATIVEARRRLAASRAAAATAPPPPHCRHRDSRTQGRWCRQRQQPQRERQGQRQQQE